MIQSILCTYILSGERFSPDLLIISDAIKILEKYNVGDLIKFGIFKGSYATESSLMLEGTIDDILIFAKKIKESKFSNLITNSNIYLTICYEEQCNFELSQEYLHKFASLEIPLGITCYEKNDNS